MVIYMAVLRMRKLGEPVLREKAKEVEKITPELKAIFTDMADSMAHYNGIGLACPQVGIDQRLVVVKLEEDFPLIELINPVLISCEGSEVGVEGCLSVPGIYGEVERCTQVMVEFTDIKGKRKRINVGGLLARALQHELDHLDGVLFVDKVINYVTGEE
jgi:peptide deformylase